MTKAIFVNLIVTNLQRSIDFYKALGFTFNEQLTDEQSAAIAITDTMYAMLHTPASMSRFTENGMYNPDAGTEGVVTLQFEQREEVEQLLRRARAAGAAEQRPAQDHGFMLSRSFTDPDGHIWEAFWMNLDTLLG